MENIDLFVKLQMRIWWWHNVSEILAGNIISSPVYAGLITSINGSSIQILGPSNVINTVST